MAQQQQYPAAHDPHRTKLKLTYSPPRSKKSGSCAAWTSRATFPESSAAQPRATPCTSPCTAGSKACHSKIRLCHEVAVRYRLHVHSKIWRKLRIDAGAAVEVTLLVDTEPREALLPPDLAASLADTPRALAIFNILTVALRRQIVQYVDNAKQARTREKRVALIVQRMLERAPKRRKLRSRKSEKTPKKGSKQKRGRNNSHRKMPQRKQM